MGFRRDSDAALTWARWLASNREELRLAGIPDEIFVDEHRWHRFAGHGFDPETGWHVKLLSIDEQQRLRELLVREYGPRADLVCLGPP
jgi:hypothetical protein